jgi:hypothetical protein
MDPNNENHRIVSNNMRFNPLSLNWERRIGLVERLMSYWPILVGFAMVFGMAVLVVDSMSNSLGFSLGFVSALCVLCAFGAIVGD